MPAGPAWSSGRASLSLHPGRLGVSSRRLDKRNNLYVAVVATARKAGVKLNAVERMKLCCNVSESQTDLGKVLWIPPLGWEIGYLLWGWVVDRFAMAGDQL
jgi:hypothetical protein